MISSVCTKALTHHHASSPTHSRQQMGVQQVGVSQTAILRGHGISITCLALLREYHAQLFAASGGADGRCKLWEYGIPPSVRFSRSPPPPCFPFVVFSPSRFLSLPILEWHPSSEISCI